MGEGGVVGEYKVEVMCEGMMGECEGEGKVMREGKGGEVKREKGRE